MTWHKKTKQWNMRLSFVFQTIKKFRGLIMRFKTPHFKQSVKAITVGFILFTIILLTIFRIPFLNTPIYPRLLAVNELREILPREMYFPNADDGNELSSPAGLLVNTSKCKIVRTAIMPEFWVKNWKKINSPVCKGKNLYGRLSEHDDVSSIYSSITGIEQTCIHCFCCCSCTL